MSRTLTYGMVGGGPGAFIGDAHRRAIALDGSARLVAGCFSRSPEKSRAQGETLGLDPERCYTNYQEMARAESAREDGIDFVVVVTPNVTHYEICKAFLEAGIHVACDKPLAVDSAQGEELARLAREKGLLFMVTYNLHRPCHRQVRPGSDPGGGDRHRPYRYGGVSPGLALQ